MHASCNIFDSRPRSQFFTLRTDPISRQIACLFFPAVNLVVLQIRNGFVYAALVMGSASPSSERFVKNLGNEWVTLIVDKERCIKDNFLELFFVSCIYFTS